MRRLLIALAAAATLVVSAPAAVADAPTATSVTSVRAVGAVFFPSVAGLAEKLHIPHFCSASVVHSAGHDLVVTAAHCVYGTGATIEFAPGFHDNVAPYGVWSVRRIYIDPAWKKGHPASADVAFLQMAPRDGKQIEDVVGARRLGSPVAGRPVTVVGYPMGSGGEPITCTDRLYETSGFPSFDCAGYVDGTSGGPWIQSGAVVGVIGGYEQGGCSGSTSYTAPFGATVRALFKRARAGGPGDLVPIGFFANAC
ncbi:MAG TPA: trypsin-like peptidase domain-containing protein [Marmoricola sp.]